MSLNAPTPEASTHQHQVPAVWPRVVGLDLSLTGTGVADIRSWTGGASVRTIKSKGEKEATLDQRALRLHKLASEAVFAASPSDIVIIEQPAYSQTGGSHHDRSGLWWMVVDKLIENGVRVVEVTPQGVKMYATGKGNASKDEVLAAVIRRYPDVNIANNNEADAFVLAAIGARLADHPLEESLPVSHLRALEKIRWNA